MKDKKRGIGLRYALHGLLIVFLRERNFKIHTFAFLFVIIAGYIFRLTLVEWGLIVIVSLIVFICEVFNSCIELMIDYLNPAQHPTAKKIKDMSASAVLIASISSVIIGLLIFIPKLIQFI